MVGFKNIHRQLFIIFTVLSVFALPFSIKLCSISIVLLTANWLIEGNLRAKWEIIKLNKLIWVLSGFYILHILGMLIVEDMDSGLYDLEKKLSLFVLPIVIGASERLSTKEMKIIFCSFIISCLIAVIVSLIFIILSGHNITDPEHLNFDYLNKDNFRNSFSGPAKTWNLLSYVGFGSFLGIHPTYFSLYIAFAVILLVWQFRDIFKTLRYVIKILYSIVLLILLIALVFLSSRIVIVSFSTLCILLLGNYFFRKQKYLYGALYSCAFISIILLLIYINPVTYFRVIQEPLNTGLQYPSTDQQWNSWNLRLVQWKSSLKIIKNNWLTGVGTGDSQQYLNQEYDKIGLGIFQSEFNAHNQYLQTTLDLGILGFSFLILSFFYPVIKSGNNQNTLFLSFLYLFGVCCLSESMLEVQKGVVFYGLFNSLLIFHVLNLNPKKYA
ncbi:O-antigen ligase family protein [Fulvivirga kasyanovii]|uniref:O-antigen ligase domain-containing protein n=1 Tax=Fulvivirga kasyanovii TaxID=396812 RepID=A0ABW9RLA4_9BACT|nr:O-antigen ligase family protein [Fulvivirga kasyanovii]MTI24756.1 O-antigen ligase domain-containing protein [Fulvivirga kasyanovii]